MSGIRSFLRQRAGLVALLLALVLAARMLVPTGYMTEMSASGLTIELCSGVAGKTVTLALPGSAQHKHDGKTEMATPCAFSGGGFDSATMIDPLVLAIAIAFVMASGFFAIARRAGSAPSHLRPPLRGPPHA